MSEKGIENNQSRLVCNWLISEQCNKSRFLGIPRVLSMSLDLILKFFIYLARIVHVGNHNWPVFLFFKVRLGKCRHTLWQNGPKIDHQKFYWKCNRNLLKCKQYILLYHAAFHGQSLAVSREYKNTEQESWSREWQI